MSAVVPDRIFPTYADDKTTRFRPLVVPYVVLALWIGLAYLLGDELRTATPAFEGAKEITTVSNWGYMFLVGAVVMTVCSLMRDTKWLRTSLFIGGFMYTWWGALFMFSIINVPFANLNAPILYWFVAFSHFAGASLPQRALPTTPPKGD